MILGRTKKITLTSLTFTLAAIGMLATIPFSMEAIANETFVPPTESDITAPTPNSGNSIPDEALFPDIQSVVPQHLTIQNQQQKDILRFTNGNANTGLGHWSMAPEFPDPDLPEDQLVDAFQELYDVNGDVIWTQVVSQFEFHPTHNHWHIQDIVGWEVIAQDDGEVIASSDKVSFCVEDVYALTGNSNTKDRMFWDCTVSLQGVQPGWVDQYHQSTDGNQLDITGIEAGTYYLVITANPEGRFFETNYTNNVSWIEFEIVEHTTGNSQGNLKIVETGNVLCDTETEGMCGEVSANRG